MRIAFGNQQVLDGFSFLIENVESVAIIELLEDLYPRPSLYPREPKERARVRAMVEIINAGIQPLQNLNVLEMHASDPQERTVMIYTAWFLL